MSYPNFIDPRIHKNNNKFYEFKIVERNCLYPFTYMNYYKDEIIIQNNFIELPNFTNLILDNDGLPFIPLCT